jgi:hypothetical protein
MSILLSSTTANLVAENLTRLTGHALDDGAAVAELLRHELSARGVSTRRTICECAGLQLAAFAEWPREVIRAILDELECVGDVSSAPGGRVAPAPLRLVDLDGTRFAVFSGLPSSALRREFPAAVFTGKQTQRWMTGADLEGPDFMGKVSALGGLIMSPERWSGMDRVPACGADWLDELARRLEFDSCLPESWDFESLDEWSVYVPDASVPAQRKRWCRSSKVESGQLWRSRHRMGWWVYAWTEGAAPMVGRSLKLQQDDAMRAAFSLDAGSGAPQAFHVTIGPEVEVMIDAFLPLAEYRLLNVSGRQSRDVAGYFRYCFDPAVWERLRPVLLERLGVELKEGRL